MPAPVPRSPSTARRRRPTAPSPAGAGATLLRQWDDDRRRLSRVLHDSTAQELAAAAMNLAVVEREAAALSPAARGAFERAQALLDTGVRSLGELTRALHPPLIEGHGLEGALRGLIRRRAEGRVGLELEGLPMLDEASALALYRLVETALEGAFASTAPVQITLVGERRPAGRAARGVTVRLMLVGRGRPQPEVALATFGMGQRLRAVGGRLTVRPGRARLALEARLLVDGKKSTAPGR